MSFPFDVEEIEALSSEYEMPREYQIDFTTGNLTGNIVDGIEALKTWVYLTLHTSRYRHIIYSWDYGNELEDLLGQSFTQEYLNTEIPRLLEESLLINPHIKSITDVNVTLNQDKLSGSFKINTDYGEADINV